MSRKGSGKCLPTGRPESVLRVLVSARSVSSRRENRVDHRERVARRAKRSGRWGDGVASVGSCPPRSPDRANSPNGSFRGAVHLARYCLNFTYLATEFRIWIRNDSFDRRIAGAEPRLMGGRSRKRSGEGNSLVHTAGKQVLDSTKDLMCSSRRNRHFLLIGCGPRSQDVANYPLDDCRLPVRCGNVAAQMHNSERDRQRFGPEPPPGTRIARNVRRVQQPQLWVQEAPVGGDTGAARTRRQPRRARSAELPSAPPPCRAGRAGSRRAGSRRNDTHRRPRRSGGSDS